MTDIQGRVAVVTGGAHGIGLELSKAFLRRGASVVIGDVDADNLGAARRELAALGPSVAVRCDVSSDDDVDALAASAVEAFGGVDILVNNAGTLVWGLADKVPIEDWARVLDVNVLGIVRGVRAFLPLLKERGGHLVNTASTSGLMTYSYDRIVYGTSKYAAVGLSEGLWLYLQTLGVRVSCICPGLVTTGMGSRMKVVEPDTLEGARQRPPAAYPGITAEEAAEVIVAGIEADRFLILTHPGMQAEVRRRGESLDDYLSSTVLFGGELST